MNDGAVMELTADRCEVECLHPEHVAPLLGKIVAGSEAESLAATFELLADPTRARLLHALSLQLRLLRDRRVVTRRKEGRVVYYRLADEHIRHVLKDGLRHVREALPQ